MTDTAHCPSCGVAYTEHMGLIGTCKELQESLDSETRMMDEIDRLRVALKNICTQISAGTDNLVLHSLAWDALKGVPDE